MRTSPQELFEAGAHIGHQRKRWNPKTRPYIFAHRGGVTIIDLVKTCGQIEKACEMVRDVVAGGGDVWFIGTKKQAKEIVKDGASSVDMPFCVNRWLGGTLTNFQTIEKSLNKYRKFLHMEESGEISKMHKKEGAAVRREMVRMGNNFEGLMAIEELPMALFAVDVGHERIAIAEARKIGIPVVAIVDTNSDPTAVDYPIVCNDDSVKTIRLITALLLEGIQEGISVRGEKKSSKKKILSTDELVKIVPEVSISQEIVDEMAGGTYSDESETAKV
jgi:small subunit ribosomal protein S2